MCGRFSLFVPPSVLEERFEASSPARFAPRYNVAPGDDVAAIRNDAPGEIDLVEWGLLPAWVDDPEGYPSPINARAETVAEKPSFREAFRRRRCLVLADGFYEWRGDRGAKRPYRIVREDREPFAMAGLWETWEGEADEGRDAGAGGKDGTARRTVAIVTTAANDTLAPIHDRMPVVLEPAEERQWLGDGSPDQLSALLDPYPDGALRAYPVSTAVNDPANDSPEVVEPVDVDVEVDAGEQSGLSEFG